VLDVPTPVCRPGGVLVQSLFSLISTGTEMMKLAEAKMSMVGKARARPDQVRKVLDTVSQQGAVATYKKVMNRLDSYTPLGYSLCGVVVEVGPGAEEFRVGQLVAAAGNDYALHAEYNWVPSNLCAVVPKGVLPEHAAFSTVGAIAMHGVRRAEVQLGDTACVIGLGLVGQLVVRLLVASGVRVTGLDVLEERCRAAEKAGADLCAPPTDEGIDAVQQALGEISGGRGADHLFLAAGGSSNGPVEAAARLARDRAHVVDIGKTRLDLPWNAYYDKELDVRFSRSYGPGRYDDRYRLRRHGLGLGERGGRAARVPRTHRGRPPAGDQPGRLESGARRPQRYLRAASDRLHRGRQLRLLDAAAESGQAGQRLPLARRDHAVPVRGQRPAPLRLQDRVHDRGRGT
jgi:threonine dehydrogenase-like Zn-dependent dehydrogenase